MRLQNMSKRREKGEQVSGDPEKNHQEQNKACKTQEKAVTSHVVEHQGKLHQRQISRRGNQRKVKNERQKTQKRTIKIDQSQQKDNLMLRKNE